MVLSSLALSVSSHYPILSGKESIQGNRTISCLQSLPVLAFRVLAVFFPRVSAAALYLLSGWLPSGCLSLYYHELAMAASRKAGISMHTTRPPFRSREYLVSTDHYLATMAGVQILQQGGNAADAGVAAGLCLNTVVPESAHFGGVAPIIHSPGTGGPIETISGLGRWPRAAHIQHFVHIHDGDMPEGFPRTITPAAPDSWLTALAHWGTMTFEEVVQPALDLARNGRPVDDRFHQALQAPDIRAHTTTAAVFLPGGIPPAPGHVFRQPDLARTFQRMIDAERRGRGGRRQGIRQARDLIYRGEIAREIADYHAQTDSLLAYEDLRDFTVRMEAPEMIHCRGLDVYSCGPWCQGPSLLMALGILEGLDLRAMGHNSADYLHILLETIKLVFADREAYFGDPDFVRVPMRGLLNPAYTRRQRHRIDPRTAAPGMPACGDPWPFEPDSHGRGDRTDSSTAPVPAPQSELPWASDTSYLCVVDCEGNAFSATPSDGVGGAAVVPGLGFPISHRGTQSWLDPRHASALQPGKRPRLTPNPALVMQEGRPFMPLGCPGGDAQVQGMLQVLLNVVEFGMDPQTAIEAPRVISHSFPNSFWPHISRDGEVTAETRIENSVRTALQARGHILDEDGDWSGAVSRVCAIAIDSGTGIRTGGADPRTTAYAAGW